MRSVALSENAEREAAQACDWIAERDPTQADRWLRELQIVLQSLREYPERCPLAPEGRLFLREIRQLVFGDHRILFRIELTRVVILHIRHGARSTLPADPIDGERPPT
jgi:plasmid stabilization system protein ParE